MNRIYDSLARSVAERIDHNNVVDFPDVSQTTYDSALTAKLLEFCRFLEREFGSADAPFVQLIAARRGTGTTRISRALATACAEERNKRVLIIDADAGFPHFCHYCIQPKTTWLDTLRRNQLVTDACHTVGRSGIFLMKAWRELQGTAVLTSATGFDDSMEELRESFDLIIFDSAPIEDAPDSVEIAPFANGSVLVVGAEKTKWQVAVNLRDEIETRGGYVLGVLLNELRFHIPAPIYDRL